MVLLEAFSHSKRGWYNILIILAAMEASMFAGLVQKMIKTHDLLDRACQEFGDAVRADKGLPVLLPEYPGAADREAAIAAMTQTWNLSPGETVPMAGLVCSSTQTIQQAERLNEVKQQFQDAVILVRNSATGEKNRIDKLIDRMLQQEGRRTAELDIALKQARLSRLNLLRCYSKIRILEPNLHSISWTWAKTHSAIDPTTREEAIELAESITNPSTRDLVIARLSALPPGEPLAYKKKLPNQLRANLVWKEDTSYRRKAVTISGIVLSQDSTLPKYIWRDNPGDVDPSDRMKRTDACIEPEPYIKALHLHRYLNAEGETN